MQYTKDWKGIFFNAESIRRRAMKGYIGSITNQREVTRDISFLKKGSDYTLTLFKDRINADKNAIDYKKELLKVNSASKFPSKWLLKEDLRVKFYLNLGRHSCGNLKLGRKIND